MKIDLTHLMNEADAFAWDAYREGHDEIPVVSVLYIDRKDATTFNVATYPSAFGAGFVITAAHAIALSQEPHAAVLVAEMRGREYAVTGHSGKLPLLMELLRDGRISAREVEAELGDAVRDFTQLVILGEDREGNRQVRLYKVCDREDGPGKTMVPEELGTMEDSIIPLFPFFDDGAERLAECHAFIHSPEWRSARVNLVPCIDPDRRKEPLLLPLDR